MRWLLLGIGAPAAAVAFALATGDARGALAQGWPPFALVAGLLLIGAAAGAEGLFEAAGRAAGRLGGGGATQLAGSLLLVALVTAILNLDTAVVFLTPVLLHLARSRGLDDEPFLYGVVLMANAGSLFLPGSNLTNLIVLAHEDVGGAVFAARMLPAALASVAVTALVLTLVYRTRLARREVGDDGGAPFRPGAGSAGVVAAVVLVLALQEPALPVLALGVLVAIAARGCTRPLRSMRSRRDRSPACSGSWSRSARSRGRGRGRRTRSRRSGAGQPRRSAPERPSRSTTCPPRRYSRPTRRRTRARC